MLRAQEEIHADPVPRLLRESALVGASRGASRDVRSCLNLHADPECANTGQSLVDCEALIGANGMRSASEGNGRWTFLTNHAHVLLSIASDPEVRLRDIADAVGITERAAQRIVSSLVADGYLVRSRVGRRSHYEVTADLSLRHSIESHHTVGELVRLLSEGEAAEPASRSASSEPQQL